MCSYQGDTRPWCYTTKDAKHWGYCDCAQAAEDFTRPIGWQPAFQNMGPTGGGDVYLLSDDLHHPVVGLLYEALSGDDSLSTTGWSFGPHHYTLDRLVGARSALAQSTSS